jgi:hypothetical protein
MIPFTSNNGPEIIYPSTGLYALKQTVDLTSIYAQIKDEIDQYIKANLFPDAANIKQIIKKIIKENILELFPTDIDPFNVKQQCNAINQQLMNEYNKLKDIITTIQQSHTILEKQNSDYKDQFNKINSNLTRIDTIAANKANRADLKEIKTLVESKPSFDQLAAAQNIVETNTNKKLKEANEFITQQLTGELAAAQNIVEQNATRRQAETMNHVRDTYATAANLTRIDSILANKANKADLNEVNTLLNTKANKSDLNEIKLNITNANKRIQLNEQLVKKRFKHYQKKLIQISREFIPIKRDIKYFTDKYKEVVATNNILDTLVRTLTTQLFELETNIIKKFQDIENNTMESDTFLNQVETTNEEINKLLVGIQQEIENIKQTNLLPIEQINALSLQLNKIESKYSRQYDNIWESLDILDNQLQKTNKELENTQINIASFMVDEMR